MKKEDERESRIHAESARNAYFVAVLMTGAFMIYKTVQNGEVPSEMMAVFIVIQIVYAASVIYYKEKGVRDSLALSSLRSQ